MIPPQPLSQSEFRDRLVKLFLAADPDATVTVTDDLEIEFARKSGAVTSVHLQRGYDDYLKDPSQLDDITSKWKALVVAPPAEATDLRKQIVYIVRHASYLKPDPGLPKGARVSTALSRPFAGDQIVILMSNNGTTVRGVREAHLEEAGLTEAEAWRLAEINVKSQVGPLSVYDLHGVGPRGYTADSGLAPSLLAHPDACTGPNAHWNDGQLVLVADRNLFIMPTPYDPLSLERFWAFVEHGIAEHQFISETPLICRNYKWEVAEIPR